MKKCGMILVNGLMIFWATLTMAQSTAYRVPQPNSEDVVKFGLVYGEIKQFYVHTKEDKQLFENAIRGMLQGLDPHSSYLDEEEYKEFKNQSDGNFVGIGVEISSEKGAIKVITPLDGSPAAKAGIKAGDYIIAVNNKPIVDMSITKIVRMIRGKPGTTVVVTVINKTDSKPRKLTITRAPIVMQSVRSEMLPDGFGYIRISQFSTHTDEDVEKAVNTLQAQSHGNLKGIILDMRNNPGGLLESAVNVVDIFLDGNQLGKNKLIVYTKGRFSEARSEYNAKPKDLLNGKPLVVLVNEGSASGAEVVAGALQDHKRAVIVGQRTFGKGSVQTLLPLDDKTAIKLTTALYYTPNGRSIQAHGIDPDILVGNMEIKKGDEDALFFLSMRENLLDGHLKNGSVENEKTVDNTKDSELASKDFQLHEALTVLKALSLANQEKGKSA